jgi:hypothetical protein
MARPPPRRRHSMTIRTSKKREAFGRLFVLGGFALVTPLRASGGDTDEVNARLKREQGSAKMAVVRDVGQESLNGTTGSRREEDDRQAIERGEDEGMIVGRE